MKKTGEEWLNAFLAPRQGKRITEQDVENFRLLIGVLLEDEGEKPDDDFRYEYLLEDMLQLNLFSTTIPMKRLKRYLQIRTKPTGYEHSEQQSEAKILDHLGELLSKNSNPRFVEKDWWE